MKREKGVTLISLVITIIVLAILASVATYSGIEFIKKAKLDKFTTEMKIMQTEVNSLYQDASENNVVEVNGNEYTGTEIYNIGKDLDSQADKVFTSSTSGITDKTGYRYYDQETIKGLGIDSTDGEFYVNVEKRSIVATEGLEYEGVTYYTLDQLPSGLYNVEYENKNTGKPTFDVTSENIGNEKWKITISNIQYDGYIDKWEVEYQIEGQDYWSTSEDLSFIVNERGNYSIKIKNGDIKSEIKQVKIVNVAEKNYTYEDINGETAEIPKGFEVSEKPDEQIIDNGLVIIDESGNEFVWIPVKTELEYVFNKNYPGLSSDVVADTNYLPDGIKPSVDNSLNNEQAERNAVLKVKGFYIGRYETGKENEKIVSKKGATVCTDTKNNSKILAKSFINNSSVKSAMCSGIQWDVTMNFVNGKKDGNGYTFDVLQARQERHRGEFEPSGNNIEDKVNNIYDLEGNFWEWTAEKNSNNTTKLRGGAAADITAAAFRSEGLGDSSSTDITFRMVLYVMK